MMPSRLQFEIEARAENSQARAARFQTLHGEVLSPLFMPVGTQATVKAQTPFTLEDAGSQILLANTYHLLLRPGPEVFELLGGYHGFTSWTRSVLTDSGGFQIFSLPETLRMSEEGAAFRSYLDGRQILLSPERSIATQVAIGSDIMMVLDQCIPSTAARSEANDALGITHRWAARSLDARGDSPQALFAIIQGALFPDLRRQSAEGLTTMPFDGFAIGGLAVGESKSEREEICELTAGLLPADRPRYLMGVGTPLDILEAVHRGVDMFDCIIPTQVAQHGTAFSSRGIIRMRRGLYRLSEEPLDAACSCPTCKRFSRAYLHHLLKAKEPLSWQLLGQHNIYFYHQLMREIRQSILENRFLEFYRQKRSVLSETDLDYPPLEVPLQKRSTSQLGAYEVHRQPGGFASIRHVCSGEIMHSRTPPMEEAHELYVVQSRLTERLKSESTVVIWDVGLGAAANAMAALACYETLAHAGRAEADLHIISFENDLDSLRLAIRNNKDFTYLRHPGPAAIIREGHWQSKTHPGLRWTLLPGDFRGQLNDPRCIPPDLIFFDMFSSQIDRAEWTFAAFTRLYAACKDEAAVLFTYSCSTAVRASMLASGFFVAKGKSTGVRSETTIALTPKAAVSSPHRLLGRPWLEKWQRSTAQFPAELERDEHEAFALRILGHKQFRGLALDVTPR